MSDSTSELVSIITPCYNGARFLMQTIDSVRAQTYTNWELLIVDDGSQDDSVAIIKAYMQQDERITYILQENAGSAEARNMAIKLSSGDYLAFLDADDIWHSDYLETMLAHIHANADASAAIFFSGYRRMDATCTERLLPDFSCPGTRDFKKLLLHCPIFPSAAIIVKARLHENVFFRKSLRSLRDDYVFWLDILSQELTCVGFADILVDYRMRSDSLTASKWKMISPQWRIYRQVLHFSVFKSFFYLCSWALNGLQKYHKGRRA